jgi:hypothetical protein
VFGTAKPLALKQVAGSPPGPAAQTDNWGNVQHGPPVPGGATQAPVAHKSRLFASFVTANNSVGPFDGSGLSAYRIEATSVTTNGNISSGIYADRA